MPAPPAAAADAAPNRKPTMTCRLDNPQMMPGLGYCDECDFGPCRARYRPAALRAAQDMRSTAFLRWLPISEAPKSTIVEMGRHTRVEGRYILAFCPDEAMINPLACICIAWWDNVGGPGAARRWGWIGEAGHEIRPTHWLFEMSELPAPPAMETPT